MYKAKLINGKLMLTSSDIQVGDDIYDKVGRLWKNINDFDLAVLNKIDQGYKIIGEVSPEAKWVKEGMEFNENELQFQTSDHPPFEGWETVSLKVFIETDCWAKRIRTIGPCGHFH